MAAAVSASPIHLYHHAVESRRHSTRAAARVAAARTQAARNSPKEPDFRRSHVKSVSADSSDDEDLAPIKLSAEAQAILGEDNSHIGSDKENNLPSSSTARPWVKEIPITSSRTNEQGERFARPTGLDGSPIPRAARPNTTGRPSPPAVLERDGSFAYKVHDKNKSLYSASTDAKTPGPRMRHVRVSGSRSHTRSPPSTAREKSAEKSNDEALSPDHVVKQNDLDEWVHVGPSTVTRSRRNEDHGGHSTLRVRRIGTGSGKFLHGPIRRGVIRRHSEDDDMDQNANEGGEQQSPEIEYGRRAEIEMDNNPDDLLPASGSPQSKKRDRLLADPQSRTSPERHQIYSHQRPSEHSPVRRTMLSTSTNKPEPTPVGDQILKSGKSSNSSRRSMFKMPLPPLDSAHDQENEPPPTFKRSKPAAPVLEIHEEKANEPNDKAKTNQPAVESPSRPPLVPRSNNTPHRPAPAPPPKLSLVDAATSNAGNSRSKKIVQYVLNGRPYRRLDVIGRGGSSKVFRIMAENYKIFALKRVNLEEADMAAIAGFKGEIELLKKLENVDRVIRLFDYEVNEEKGVLSVMMELGESDFNKMLNEQIKADNAKLDTTFTRHYWKEMLECVQAVHDHDIVHSDLKPHNFLLVKGQLKLIDFGIANAIQDNTVNVHRENQIGTPNYMSPESLVCHAPAVGQAAGTKVLKLGKPSDVWSLGCILYQMTYGQPPFAHITKQFERIMAIPNPEIEIQFPTTGLGGAVVPFGLIKTLRRCLQRDQSLRPTIKELLSDQDPFLNPVAISPDMLGRVIGNVVSYCRKREETFRQQGQLGQDGVSCLPRDEEMRGWPLAFYEKLRQAQEEGTAW